MSDIILPNIGTSGFFELKEPLNKYVIATERYTCKAIRRLSELIASNEEPQTEIYAKYGIPSAEYTEDLKADMLIISLQSEKGFWLYVPARYILKYPATSGVPYRTLSIGVSLPSLPVDIELGHLEQGISNIVTDMLGIDPVIKSVETSRVVLVDKDKHDQLKAKRSSLVSSRTTDTSRYRVTKVLLDAALLKIAELEAYMFANMPWKPAIITKPIVTLPEALSKYNTFTSSELEVSGGRFVLTNATWEITVDGHTYPIESAVSIEGDMFSWTNTIPLDSGDYTVRVKYSVTGLKGVWSDPVPFTVVLPFIIKPTVMMPNPILSLNNLFTGSEFKTNIGQYDLLKVVWEFFDGADIEYLEPLFTYSTLKPELLNNKPLGYGVPYKVRIQYHTQLLDPVYSDIYSFVTAKPKIAKPTIKAPDVILDMDNIFKGSTLVVDLGIHKLKNAIWYLYKGTDTVPMGTYITNALTLNLPDTLEFGQTYSLVLEYEVEELDSVMSDPYTFTVATPVITVPTLTLPDRILDKHNTFVSSPMQVSIGPYKLTSLVWEIYGAEPTDPEVPLYSYTDSTPNTNYKWVSEDMLAWGTSYRIRVTHNVERLPAVSSDYTPFTTYLPVIAKPTIKVPAVISGSVTFTSSTMKTDKGTYSLAKSIWSLVRVIGGVKSVVESVELDGYTYTPAYKFDYDADTTYELTVTYLVDGLTQVDSDVVSLTPAKPGIVAPTIALPKFIGLELDLVASAFKTTFGTHTLSNASWEVKNVKTGQVTTSNTSDNKLSGIALELGVQYEVKVTYMSEGLDPVSSIVYSVGTTPLTITKPSMAIVDKKLRSSTLTTNHGVYGGTDPIRTKYVKASSVWQLIDTKTGTDILTAANNTRVYTTDLPLTKLDELYIVPFDTEIMIYGRDYDLKVKYTLEDITNTVISSAESNTFTLSKTTVNELYKGKVHFSDDVPNPFDAGDIYGNILTPTQTGTMIGLAPKAFAASLDTIIVGYGTLIRVKDSVGATLVSITGMTWLYDPTSWVGPGTGGTGAEIEAKYPEFKYVSYKTLNTQVGLPADAGWNDWKNLTVEILTDTSTGIEV